MAASALTCVAFLVAVPPCPQDARGARPDLQPLVTEYFADLQDLGRRYDVPMSAEGRDRRRAYLEERRASLRAMDGAALGRDARIDRWLLLDHVERELAALEQEERETREIAPLTRHAAALIAACAARRRHEAVDPEAAAAMLAEVTAELRKLIAALGAGRFDDVPVAVANRADRSLQALHRAAEGWFGFYDGYDPAFSWWVRAPWREYEAAQRDWRQKLRARLVDRRSEDASLIGDPVGEAALLAGLEEARIPYSPAELIEIAEREFAWCDREFAVASTELGCGDDWRAALELVKRRHVAPGEQPALIRELALEAIDFVEEHDLVTVPPLAKECWRMSMMSAEAQRTNPFFLGGNTIQVSFPTDEMEHERKLQSLRSNNVHFCRATVHHELIPGHWLQQYSQARHRSYRRPFSTPFWIEGWALYWEMRLYDLGLAQSPEDRVGMLYWRKHRCARIVFSLKFHLGEWDARQCIDYLVERVGHEPAAAEGEVRRSVSGAYGPLYQAAYMLGGLQFRALHRELVGGGHMTEREFHDAVLRQGSMPIALVRAALSPEMPPADELPPWRFADDR